MTPALHLIGQAAGAGILLRRREDRLSCIGPTGVPISSHLQQTLSDQKTLILKHLQDCESRHSHLGTALESCLPMSPLKANIFYEYLLHPAASSYNVGILIEARGELDRSAWVRAWQRTLSRHCDLRSLFTEQDDGELCQLIFASPALPARLVDLSATEPAAQADPIRQTVADILDRPFALDRELPLRLAVITCDRQRHLLAVCLHHIVADPDTLALLIEEIREDYGALNRRSSPPPPQIADAVWSLQHHAWIRTQECAEQLQALCEEVSGTAALFDTHAAEADELQCLPLNLPSPLVDELLRAASLRGHTAFVFVLATYARALSRATGRTEFLIGVPTRALTDAVARRALGCFVNLMPIRIEQPLREPSAFLRDVSHRVRTALERQRVPLALVRERLASRRQGRPPEIQAVLTFITHRLELGAWPGLKLRCLDSRARQAKFMINAQLQLTGNTLRGNIETLAGALSCGEIRNIVPLMETELRSLLQDVRA